jgi:hypothetical protein
MPTVKVSIFYGSTFCDNFDTGPLTGLANDTVVIESSSTNMYHLIRDFLENRTALGRTLLSGDTVVLTEYFQKYPLEGYKKYQFLLMDSPTAPSGLIPKCVESTPDVFRDEKSYFDQANVDTSPYDQWFYMGVT